LRFKEKIKHYKTRIKELKEKKWTKNNKVY
jgi:hypothetical protein